MSEQSDKIERDLEGYYAAQREAARAPAGLASRVEASIAAETQHRRAWRRPAIVVVPAAAAAIAGALFLILGLVGGNGGPTADEVLAGALDAIEDPGSVGLQSYSGVAEFIASPGSEDLNPDFDQGDPSITEARIPEDRPPIAADAEMHVWFQAPDSFRLEFDAGLLGIPLTMITDGETAWTYDSRANVYSARPVDETVSDPMLPLFGPGAFDGTIEELLARFQNDTEHDATLVGEEEQAGREAYVIEVSPSWTSSGTRDDGTPYDESGGVVRFWLDKQYLFSLGWEAEDRGGGQYGYAFAEIDFNSELDEGLFTFEPPAGARQVEVLGFEDTTGGGGSISGPMGHDIRVPAGFLKPTYFPAGYQGQSAGSSYEGDTTYEAEFLILQDRGNGYISAHELRDRGDLPESLKRGDDISLRGEDAWLWQEGDLWHLAWQEDDLVVYMIARGIDGEELVRVAESMEVSEGDDDGPIILDEGEAGEFAEPVIIEELEPEEISPPE